MVNNIAEWTGIGITAYVREAEDWQKWRKMLSHQNAPKTDKGYGNDYY